MDIKDRIEALKAERLRIEAKLAEDTDEIELRAALAREEEATEAAKAKARDLDIQRRLDAVRERLGEKVHVAAVAIDGHPDTYIIAHNERAFQSWQRVLNSQKKTDYLEGARRYAMAVIQDWNGHAVGDLAAASAMITVDGAPTTIGDALGRHLRANSAQITPINNEAARLAGLRAAERKSDG